MCRARSNNTFFSLLKKRLAIVLNILLSFLVTFYHNYFLSILFHIRTRKSIMLFITKLKQATRVLKKYLEIKTGGIVYSDSRTFIPRAMMPPIAPLAISLCPLYRPTTDKTARTIIARNICGLSLPIIINLLYADRYFCIVGQC